MAHTASVGGACFPLAFVLELSPPASVMRLIHFIRNGVRRAGCSNAWRREAMSFAPLAMYPWFSSLRCIVYCFTLSSIASSTDTVWYSPSLISSMLCASVMPSER